MSGKKATTTRAAQASKQPAFILLGLVFASLFNTTIAQASSEAELPAPAVSLLEPDGSTAALSTETRVQSGTTLRLTLPTPASANAPISRVEFFERDRYIGDGVYDAATGTWLLDTAAPPAPVYIPDRSDVLITQEKNNGSFEDWLSGAPSNWSHSNSWTYDNSYWNQIARENGDAAHASSALRLTSTLPTHWPANAPAHLAGTPIDANAGLGYWSSTWLSCNNVITPGTTYRLRFKAKRVNGPSTSTLEFGNGYNRWGGASYDATPDGNGNLPWRAYEFEAVAGEIPQSVTTFNFAVSGRGASWLIDDVELSIPQDVASGEELYSAKVIDETGRQYISSPAKLKLEPFRANINFQPESASTPLGYLADSGQAFFLKNAAHAYGWSRDVSASAKQLEPADTAFPNEPATHYNFIPMRDILGYDASWEMRVPNGYYKVNVILGAAAHASNTAVLIENQAELNNRLASESPWLGETRYVSVHDGRLSLRAASPQAINNLAAITIEQVGSYVEKARYSRGTGDLPAYRSFVTALEGQRGVRRHSSRAEQEHSLAHFSFLDNDYKIAIDGPIAYFGSHHGGSPLYTGQSYAFGVRAGKTDRVRRSRIAGEYADTHTSDAFVLKVYRKSDDALVEEIDFAPPESGSANWLAFLQAGKLQVVDLPQYGLKTYVEKKAKSEWDFKDSASHYSSQEDGSYIFSHIGSSTDYYFSVHSWGYFYNATGEKINIVKHVAGAQAGRVSSNPLYTFSFDEQPPFSAALLKPHFQQQPMPSTYSGGELENLLAPATGSPLYPIRAADGNLLEFSDPAQISAFQNNFLQVDHSPELRSHDQLDTFLQNHHFDPIAITNYIVNEVELTDYMSFANTPIVVNQSSLELGGLRRGALATLLEGQGSPTEQCALLVYALRRCGLPAAYVFPDHDSLKILDSRLSALLGMQLENTPLTPKLVPLDYPWVITYIPDPQDPGQGKWINLFPWLKDRELSEGFDLYDLMEDDFKSGFQWLDAYLRGDPRIMSLSSESDQPLALWPQFIESQLQARGDGLSIDDLGVRSTLRPGYADRWEDFSTPFVLEGQAHLVERLADQPQIFDTLQLELLDANQNLLIDSGPLLVCDLHNRPLYFDYSGESVRLFLKSFASYSPSTPASAQASFPAPNLSQNPGDAATLELSNKSFSASAGGLDGSKLTVRTTHHRHRSNPYQGTDLGNRYLAAHPSRNFWNSYYYSQQGSSLSENDQLLAGKLFVNEENVFGPGVYAFSYNPGKVTKKMLDVHARDIWRYEQARGAGSVSENRDLALGSTFYLMGASYWEYVSRFDALNTSLHKLNKVNNYGEMFTGMEHAGANQLVYPLVHISVHGTGVVWNGSSNPDYSTDRTDSWADYLAMKSTQGSAYEHGIIQHFFNDEHAYSTVKLLQIAQAGQAPGIIVLDAGNWQTQGTLTYQGYALKDHDPALWEKVTEHFDAEQINNTYNLAYITPGPIQSGQAQAMGLATLHYYGSAGMYISRQNVLNGGKGSEQTIVLEERSLVESQDGSSYQWAATDQADASEPAPQSVIRLETLAYASQAQLEQLKFDEGTLQAQEDTTSWLEELFGIDLPIEAYDYADHVANKGNLAGNVGLENSQNGSDVSDPVNVVTGEFYDDTTDLHLPGPITLKLARNYSSQNQSHAAFGWGWKLNHVPYLIVDGASASDDQFIRAAESDGSVLLYEKDLSQLPNQVWILKSEHNKNLTNFLPSGIGSLSNPYNQTITKTTNVPLAQPIDLDGDGNLDSSATVYTLHAKDGSTRTFYERSFPIGQLNRTRPYLHEIADAHGNTLSFSYYQDPLQDYGQLRSIRSSNGNWLNFEYDALAHITAAYTNDARRVEYHYDQFADLIKVTRPDGSAIEYEYEHRIDHLGQTYSNHLITRIRKPEGRILENDYDSERRVTHQRATVGPQDELLRNASFVYGPNHDPAAASISSWTRVYDVFNQPSGSPAADTNCTTYVYADNLITSITDPLGQQVLQDWFTPDEAGIAGYYPASLQQSIDKRGLITDYKYDTRGNLVEKTITGELTGSGSTSSATWSYSYNDKNLLTLETSPAGHTKQWIYRRRGYSYLPRKLIHTGPLGTRQDVFIYGKVVDGDRAAYGLLTRKIEAANSPDASVTRFAYDARGFMTSSTAYAQRGSNAPAPNPSTDVQLTFHHDARGNLIEKIDGDGTRTVMTYDAMGRLTRNEVIDAQGTRLSWRHNYYNQNGELTWSDGPRYNPEDYVLRDYDKAGRVISKTHWRSQAKADGSGVEAAPGQDNFQGQAIELFEYDGFGNLTRSVDPMGNYAQMSYDATGQLVKQEKFDASGKLLSSKSFSHEPGGQIASATNAELATTSTTYTSNGLKKSQVLADGSTQTWAYTIDARLLRETLPSGAYWLFSYDDPGAAVTRSFYNPQGTLQFQETDKFDRFGNIIEHIDRLGHSHITSYDGLGRVAEQRGPANNDGSQATVSFSYNTLTRKTFQTNARGESTVTQTDPLGRPVFVKIFSADGELISSTAHTYSPDHHSVTTTRGDAISATTFTDTFGHPILVVQDSSFTRQVFDKNQNRVAAFDELGQATTHTYDGLNRLASTTLPDGATTTFDYDLAGNRIARKMPGSLIWQAAYNPSGRITSEALIQNMRQTRNFSYTYYTQGEFIGLLKSKQG